MREAISKTEMRNTSINSATHHRIADDPVFAPFVCGGVRFQDIGCNRKILGKQFEPPRIAVPDAVPQITKIRKSLCKRQPLVRFQKHSPPNPRLRPRLVKM